MTSMSTQKACASLSSSSSASQWKHERETFGKAFLKHKEDRQVSTEQIQKWRTALKEVSKIRGRHLTDSPESIDIEEITKSIFDELNRELSDDSDRESPQEPGRRSRLWFCKDVFYVLKENTGTEVVEGIVLDFQGTEVVEGMVLNSPPRKENLNDKAFSNMRSLRLLKISNVHLPTGLYFLSNKLRMMEWHDYPLKFMPISFQPDNLVELIMPRSHIEQLPKGLTNLAKLRLLDLRDSKLLVKTPNFIGYPNLERLIFQGWFTRVFCNNKDDGQIALIRIPILPYDDFDPFLERFVEGVIHRNKYFCEFSNSTETPEWFSHQSPGSSVTIPLPSDLRDDSSWIGIAFFTSVVILENLNNVSFAQDDEVSIDFICRSDINEVSRINCPLNVTQWLPESFFRASSFGLKVLIPAGELKDHLKDCSCIRVFIRSKCTYFEIKMFGVRVLYEQDLVKFIRANGKMKQISRWCQEVVHQNKSFIEFSNSTEIPEWFSHRNLGSSIRMPLPLDLHDNSSWLGIALFAVVVGHKNLKSQDYKVFIEFNCRPDMVQGTVDRRRLVIDISEFVPEPLRHDCSFSFKLFVQAWQLRDHLKECSWISTLIMSDSPYVIIKMCGAGVVYKQDLEKFAQAIGKIKQRSQFQINKVESSQSNDRLKGKLMSLLLRVYQGDLARNHKYDYVFPHTTVPSWFCNRSFCSDIRIRLPANLQCDGRWMGIAVCAYYTVHKQPAISGDNKDLTSFLNFYNPLISRRVHLTRHKVFQESKDIFVESSHRILVFYIPHVLLRLDECQHIGASFEHNKPDVQVKECGLRLVYEQDVEKFVQALAQCMLESPDAYHECFYQNLLHQVEEREASKDFGFSSKLQRMPQPMPILQPSIENIAAGCTSSETSPSSFTGFLATARKEQYASIMSSESLIKARLEKNFDEGEIFNCCFAEREIPLWFFCEDKQSMEIPLSLEFVNNPDWMGFALCGLFLFNRNPTAVRQSLGSIEMFPFSCLFETNSCYSRLVCNGLLNINNELVTLNQRAFIWVMFIPRTTHAQFWSQSTEAKFWLRSSVPDLSAESFGINLVYRHNMEELSQILVQCSAPFDSFLDSCEPWVFCKVWDIHPEYFIGRKNSYEELHPQRLFISQEETSVTAQYSYEDGSYPHNCFRYFHPSTLYNSCFPTRRTPRWFNHHCHLGHSVTIEIPPNLYEDNNWLGLALYASILIPRDRENAVSVNSSHFLYCQFQTSKASLDNQILVFRTTDEENNWLHPFFGLIWISYIPGEALKYMLHQCGHIKASFVSDWPSVMVQKCGLRLLYQHDLSQFEQQLKHCNASISALRDSICQISRSGTIPEEGWTHMPNIPNEVVSPLNKYDQLGGHSEYSFCFPPVEILHCFNYHSNEPSVKIDISNVFFNDNKWMGLVLCAYFSSDKHQTAIIEDPSSISHHLICILETDLAGPELGIYVHRTSKKDFTWLDIEGGFLWLCYIPICPFLGKFNQCSCIKASIISDWPGIIVQKCGLSFYNKDDDWFQKIIDHCIMEKQHMSQYFNDQLIARYKVKISRATNQLSQSHLPGFDGSCDYNSCCPPTEIPHWFHIQSDESHVTFRLTRELQNRSTWLGVALCAVFLVTTDVAILNDIMDSISSCKLICHLQASNGLSVKPRHIYWPTKENLMMSLLGGFTWLTYIPRGSFPNWLYDCAFIKVSFETTCHDLKVQKSGLRLLYQDSVEEFKNCMKSESDFLGILDQKKTENINSFNAAHLIQNVIRQTDTLGFDRCIFYNSRLPSSEFLEWFDHQSEEPWLKIPLPPNLYNDSTWMGLVLCAYFAIDENPTAHFDILDSDFTYGLVYHLETNVGGVRPLVGYPLTKENLVLLQQGGCILLSYEGRGSFQNCLNQVSCIKASFRADCPGLKVEKCGLRLLYHSDLEEFEQMNSPSDDLEEFEQTISDSMNSSLGGWEIICQLPTDDGNRDKQKHDGEGTSSRTSSSRKESNFGSLRGPIDPKVKGKRVLEE
ncbi:hypothetical protein CMV_021928 [Castanea mollissima]|uniref:C-JID domain-containing protein n=1 Tax=Castanea mollissima TaxID=60419 RepID=A0A8J4QJ77_9ROSI|nr:hypothetical protein CMV_021928 [Castanea mollissima]